MFKKQKSKKVEKILKNKIIEEEKNKNKKSILLIEKKFKFYGVTLENYEIFNIHKMLKSDKYEEIIDYIYKISGKKIYKELLLSIQKEIKE